MGEYSRITEMAGIRASSDDLETDLPGTFWPLNVVLVILGIAVLSVAFYFLDPQDARILHNPWTYAVATPLCLLMFSTLISNLVSRVVEKSMQMAFLLSVLIHLLLLVYAVNIVIFSRMWPDVLDSLTEQREQLKRETLQANQYHRLSSNSQTGRRPEYLQYAPTRHQPTEIEEAESPAIQMAKSERIEMVSPSPELEKVASPHVLKRKQAATTTPTISQQAASLSRSELAEAKRATSAPRVPEEAAREVDTSLQASDASGARRRESSATLSEPTLSTLEASRSATAINMPRAKSESSMQPILQPLLLPPVDLPNAARNTRAPASSPPSELARVQPQAELLQAEDLANSVAASRRRPASNQAILTSPATQPAPDTSAQRRPTTTQIERRTNPYQVPRPTAGQSQASIPRDAAGGIAGPTAASSMRVRGPEAIAANESNSMNLQSSPLEFQRRTGAARRSASSLPQLGAPQSASWNGTPSLSGGVSGRSPLQIADAASRGSAGANDVAGLSGTSGAIERAAIGLAGPTGTLSVPTDVVGSQGEAGNSNTAIGANEAGAFAAEAARLSRSRGRGQSLAAPDAFGTTPGQASRNPETQASIESLGAMQRANISPDAVVGSAGTASAEGDSQALPRSSALAGGAPSSSEVQPLGAGTADVGDGLGSDILMADQPIRRGDRSRESVNLASPVQLDVDAADGPGGLSSVSDVTGPMLPRRRDLEPTLTSPQIDSQRFARQDVGGPLAAGRDVAIPKPAFQQRLERLQDRDPQDETAYEPQTELAIERGLAFLAKYQRPDGSWRLQDFDTKVLMRSDTAATGLALLAFQGAGYTHKQFKYADTVGRAIDFLADHQTPQGDLYIPQDPASDRNAWLYSHGIAALALCEAYGMTQDEDLRSVAQRSIDFMVASQDKRLGGWRYRPGAGTDTSVTGWFMMAFKSGQLAGLDVPKDSFNLIEGYLDQSQASGRTPHLYRYNPFASDTPQQRHGLKPTAVMTSVGLLMRLYFDWRRDNAEMVAGADYLLEHLPEHGTRTSSLRDTYYWYYATQVIFHMGGERWNTWHDRLYPLLISNQITEGENEGSWDPMLPTPDLWARYGGRLYVTTMNLLSLEVSYRHLPLYEATAQ